MACGFRRKLHSVSTAPRDHPKPRAMSGAKSQQSGAGLSIRFAVLGAFHGFDLGESSAVAGLPGELGGEEGPGEVLGQSGSDYP